MQLSFPLPSSPHFPYPLLSPRLHNRIILTPALLRLALPLLPPPCLQVDLENHSHRSFQGFLCLMQLSTRSHDYVVDLLALRSHVGEAMGRMFADPSVVKVRVRYTTVGVKVRVRYTTVAMKV